ncbi:O-antigen ligase family protein [Amnibacterium setariae]|nr:O-antigen ligase family protein [Amnibacterium setariae]
MGDTLLTAMIASVFLEKYDLYLEDVFHVPTPIFTLASTLWLVRTALHSIVPKARRSSPVLAILFLWLVALALSQLLRGLLDPGVVQLQLLLSLFHEFQLAIIALVFALTCTEHSLRISVSAVYLLAVAGALVGAVQLVDLNIGSGQLSNVLDLRFRAANGYLRPESFYSEPAYYGFFCLYGVAVAHSRLISPRLRPEVGRVFLLVSGLSSLAFGPLLVAACYIAAFMITRGPRLIAYVGASAAVLFLVGQTPVALAVVDRVDRILNAQDASSLVRAALNDASLRLIAAHPLVGIGDGQSRYVLPSLVHVRGVELTAYNQAGNSYLAVLLEGGLLSGVPLFSAILALLAFLLLNRHTWWAAAWLGMFMISWLSVSTIALPVFWVMFGVIMGAHLLGRRRQLLDNP